MTQTLRYVRLGGICFEDLCNVTVINGIFEYLSEYDCMVSAANCFGLMDGGVDTAIVNYFGTDLRVHSRTSRPVITAIQLVVDASGMVKH